MAHSSKDRMKVFDFAEEDHIVGNFDLKLQSRYQNPKFGGSPNLKYEFLACVAQESETIARKSVAVQCVDVDSIDEAVHCSSNVAMQSLTISMEDGASRPLLGCNDAMDSAFEPRCQMDENIYVHQSSNSDINNKVLSPEDHALEDGHVGSPFTESPNDSGSINSTKSTPLSSNNDRSFSSPDACEDFCADPHTFEGLDGEEVDCVLVHADFVNFNRNYYPASKMTFSHHSIKIETSCVDKDDENCIYEWAVDEDVVSIQSQYCTLGSVVKVRIHLLSKSTVKLENIQNASGIEELKVTLFDPEWYLSLEKIMSLNVKYKAAWNVLAPLEIMDDGDELPGTKSQLSQRLYIPQFDEQFEEVIYPKGDPDAVSISKRDVDRLNPETFLNDTIIDFYIKYMKNEIPVGERNRFYFFNSFFFTKLADIDKNPDSAFDGKAAFQRVRKWTRKVNIFEKDYVFIPVNYSLHWSLIVICHPGQVADFIVEKINESSSVPCILHMDSIRGTHTGLKKLIQSYLLEEWKEKKKVTSEDVSSKFLNLRYLSLELPQQENYYDCGLFLLHYVELFVKDAPVSFSPFNIAKHSNFLTVNWFIPADVSIKRSYIQRLISEILESRSQGNRRNNIRVDDISHRPKLEADDGIENNNIEFSSKSCNLQNTCTPNSFLSEPLQVIDINLRGGSPVRSSDCPSQPSSAFRDLFEPGTSSGMLFGQRHDLGSYEQPMSPIQEEDEDNAADHLYSMQNTSNFRQLDELTPEDCTIEPFRTVSWDRSFDLGDHDKDEVEDSSLDSHYDSDDDEVKVIDAVSPQNEKPNPDSPKCSLPENLDSLTDSFVSATSDIMMTPAQDSLTGNKREIEDDEAVADEGLIINNSSSDSDEMQPTKKLRLTLGCESEPETEPLENIPS